MRKILLSALMVLFSLSVFGQDRSAYRQYTPVTLFAGTAMSARTDAAALDDTTRSVDVRGFSEVGLLAVTAANDSTSFIVSYQGSHDGVTWDPVFVTIDSLNSSGNTGVTKGFPLPAKGLMYPFVRFRVKGSDSGVHSANPSTTVSSYVIKKY